MSLPGESLPQEASPEMRTIVEIGAGRIGPTDVVTDGVPFWNALPEHHTFGPDERYIGVDLGAKTIIPRPERAPGMTEADVKAEWNATAAPHDRNMYANWARIKNAKPGDITFLHADGMALPLRDESADEVVAVNVFGSGASTATRAGIYREMQRTVKSTGSIVIQDTHGPEFLHAGSLPQWIRNHNLPEPTDVRFLRYKDNPDAYVSVAQQHGLRYERYGSDITREEALEKGYYHHDTLWVLGKATGQVVQVQQPESAENRYQQWKSSFGRFFGKED